ncbi:MBL fold metallo-hydrolase [Vibrio sp. vnigr-6D03]|uniref:MBL fold metallo-hydrolase n=1 Tax=Vibrio sp. vnigr-6D03 TaxID=2058088 RepID=UPI000C3413FE|nr:MBL fold metallo-hydrolase [Vibrio sp. vnigr-6D03]PKF81349.1 MBL fold metallo-hydrolase [Vibrio sp. vnigr-6D03]
MKPIKTLLTTSLAVASFSSFGQDPVWDANTVVLTQEPLADGVFAYYPENAKKLEKKGFPVATSGGFIVGDSGVLIIDTMLNKRLNSQVQSFVAEHSKAPKIYAVNTSYHGDHSYGNMYLPESATIIQHEVSKGYVDSHFKADTEFMMSNFGKGRGIEDIVPTTGDVLVETGGQITIDLGGKQVEVIDFGFAQTGGDLFVWEPESKVLWTGNAIVAVKPALPWLLDGHLIETLETFERVYHFLPADAKVVPGHGSVIGKEDLKWHIDYLKTVKEKVQEAIDNGLTLEQTVASVTLPEFRGYALFGWVHPNMNVPAAYKDLSK